jgi:diguanylate cyclase (GGDEF)-like protein
LTGSYLFTGAPSFRKLLPDRSDFAFEGATLVLGLVTAELAFHLTWATPAMYLLVAMLHRSTMIVQLQAAAKTDGRTGLLNATAWQQLAQSLVQRAARERQPAAVMLIDLDHFKAVNDSHGHLAGDVVLRAVADCIKRELRGYDAVGRYGGEEFIAYLDRLDGAAALSVADRLRLAIRELPLDDGIAITASFGLATYPHHGANIDTLIHAADVALYSAKRAGRDRVAIHGTDLQDTEGEQSARDRTTTAEPDG